MNYQLKYLIKKIKKNKEIIYKYIYIYDFFKKYS